MMFLSCKITIIASKSKSKALCWQYGRFESIKALMGKNEENQKMFGKTVGSKPNNGFQVVHQYKPL